jgi:oligopeptide/dipeptide ABC transporter ATP-binding protein
MTVKYEYILSVQNLTTKLQLGNQAYPVVEDLSFNLHLGKTLAIVGESGCGKTLTALSILRIQPSPPALYPEGKILYKDQNLLELSEHEMRHIRGGKIAMIFQDPISSLNPVYTIGQQMVEAAELHLHLYGEEAIIKAAEALADVGIAAPRSLLSAYPHQLSGGMKQRVMIATALMCEPDILIADEPTTALDVTIQAQVLDLIRRLQAKKGMAVLLITHDMGVVAEIADEVIVMYAAQAVESGTVFQLFDQMSHPYTMGLFKSRPRLDDKRGGLQAIKGSVPSFTHFPPGCRFHPRCPFAMPKCREGNVPNFVIFDSQNGLRHTAKCWLHDGSEESCNKRQEVENEKHLA